MKQIEKSFLNVINTFNTVHYLYVKRAALASRSVYHFLGVCQIGTSSGLCNYIYKLFATDGHNIITVISGVLLHDTHIHQIVRKEYVYEYHGEVLH